LLDELLLAVVPPLLDELLLAAVVPPMLLEPPLGFAPPLVVVTPLLVVPPAVPVFGLLLLLQPRRSSGAATKARIKNRIVQVIIKKCPFCRHDMPRACQENRILHG